MNTKLKQNIKNNTISLEEFSKNFTKKQKQIVKNEIKFYDVLMEITTTSTTKKLLQ